MPLFLVGLVSKPAEPPFVQIGQIANYNLFYIFYFFLSNYNMDRKKSNKTINKK
jgi:hypothetical protein